MGKGALPVHEKRIVYLEKCKHPVDGIAEGTVRISFVSEHVFIMHLVLLP